MSALGLEPLPRGVILAATPLGNAGDASARLMQALAHADVIAAEDTRRVRNLAQALGIEISGSVVSNFDHNEQARAQQLIDAAQHGTVLVVTDAGMPLVSDPSDPLGTRDMTTHHGGLDDAADLYRTFQKKDDGCIKVVLKPRGA